jgi:hypothetical protein
MTVSIQIKDASIRDEKERFDQSEFVPVATADYFRGYWLPGATALRLKYVPQFYNPGIPLSQEDLPIVLQELAALRKWISENFPDGRDGGMLQRLDTVTHTLQRCVGHDDLDIFVG